MRESTKTIGEWAAETFGDAGSKIRIAARANEEAAELLRAITIWHPVENPGGALHIAEEAADVAIVLARFCYELGEEAWPDCFEGPAYISPDARTVQGLVALRGRAKQTAMRMAVLISKCPVVEPESYSVEARADLVHAARRIIESLAAICGQCGRQIRSEIDCKMLVNRNREWRTVGSGHGYHVRLGDEK